MFNKDNDEIFKVVVTGENHISGTDHVMLKTYMNEATPEVKGKKIKQININSLSSK